MTLSVNQFAPSVVKGQLDLMFQANTLQCRADNTTVIAGQAVKLVDIAGGIPNIAPAQDTDEVFGYVMLDAKNTTYTGYAACNVAITGTVMYMLAGAAIAASADVMFRLATLDVITATGTTKCISGKALDKIASGDLGRIYIKAFPTLSRPAT